MCDRALFPFTGGSGITKQSRPSNADGPQKTLIYYREARITLLWATFHWLSPTKFTCLHSLKILLFSRHKNGVLSLSPHMNDLCSGSLCCLWPCPSHRHPVLCLVAQRQRVWRHKGMHHKRMCCLLCEQWKGQGRLFRDVLAGRFHQVNTFHCSYTASLVLFNITSGKLRY